MPVQRSDVWEVSEDEFPRASPIEVQLGFLLRYAILAPSVRNTQPWAFSVRGNRVHLIADMRKTQPVADPDRRELYISVGCALEKHKGTDCLGHDHDSALKLGAAAVLYTLKK